MFLFRGSEALFPLALRFALLRCDGRWYQGRVLGYSAETKKHHVKFDDNDEKHYDLHAPRQVYKFVREGLVLNVWYAPAAQDEVPFTVTVPGVCAEAVAQQEAEQGQAAEAQGVAQGHARGHQQQEEPDYEQGEMDEEVDSDEALGDDNLDRYQFVNGDRNQQLDSDDDNFDGQR